MMVPMSKLMKTLSKTVLALTLLSSPLMAQTTNNGVTTQEAAASDAFPGERVAARVHLAHAGGDQREIEIA